jgi:hypothetical protein
MNGRNFLKTKLRIAPDDAKKIVEIMGDAAG